MLVALMLASLLVIVLIVQVWRRLVNDQQWRMLAKFPGEFSWPFLGNAFQIGFDADEAPKKIFDMWKRCGKQNFRVTIGSFHWVLLSDPEDVGIILSHQTELAKPPDRNAAMIPFFGESLSTSTEFRWRFFRKAMTPSFAYNTLDQRLVHVNNHSDVLVRKFNEFGSNQPVDMYRFIRPYMYDIYSSTLLGISSNLLDTPDHPYLDASSRVVRILNENYFSYWRHIETLFKLTDDYREMQDVIQELNRKSREMLEERRNKLDEIKNEIIANNPIANIDVMQMVKEKVESDACVLDDLLLNKLPNGEPIPDEMIVEELNLLSFTGHYTTTMTVSSALYLISKHPDVQKRITEEQNAIFNENNKNTKPTTKDLNQMKYLEAVIKETMRYNPTVTKIGRYLQNDLKLKDGKIIPAGTTGIVYLEALFNNENVFPDCEKFIPERFLHTTTPGFTYIPFSSGPRNCIGFKYAWVAMKATLSTLLRNFEVLDGGPGLEPVFKHRIITESINGVHLRLKRRLSVTL